MNTIDAPEPSATAHQSSISPLFTALAVMTVAAVVLGLLIANQPHTAQTATAPQPTVSPTSQPRPSPPTLPNDGWFIAAPDGLHMRANELIEDPDMLPLYLDSAEAEAIIDSGFRRVRLRSYYARAAGGGAFKIMEVDDPAGLLRRLRRTGEGPGQPYPNLPEAHIRSNVVQMENTRAHDVFAHFRTVTFLSAPYVVQIEAYSVTAPVAQRRAETYARSEHELLQSRDRTVDGRGGQPRRLRGGAKIAAATASARSGTSVMGIAPTVRRTAGGDASRYSSPGCATQPAMSSRCSTGPSASTGTHTHNPDRPHASTPRSASAATTTSRRST